MTVHCIHIFDRKGKTLFTKTYSSAATQQQLQLQQTGIAEPGSEPLDEQRKLVFGMLFSLRELVGSLTPEDEAACKFWVGDGYDVKWCLFCWIAIYGLDSNHLKLSLIYFVSLVSREKQTHTALYSIQTGASTVHNYETISGLRFALYTSNDVPHLNSNKSSNMSGSSNHGSKHGSSSTGSDGVAIRDALRYIYTELWMESVVRSPLYRPGKILSVGEKQGEGVNEKFDIRCTNFEKRLDTYLTSMPWFLGVL